MNDVLTVFVYRHPDGRTQVRCTDTDDFDLVIDMLSEALLAMSDGSPVVLS